jgi:hypothetical protein
VKFDSYLTAWLSKAVCVKEAGQCCNRQKIKKSGEPVTLYIWSNPNDCWSLLNQPTRNVVIAGVCIHQMDVQTCQTLSIACCRAEPVKQEWTVMFARQFRK